MTSEKFVKFSIFGLFLLKLLPVTCFNFDVRNAVFTKGDPGSYFGYAIAFHQTRTVSRLLIGAPNKAKNEKIEGTVYHCQKNQTLFDCNEIFLAHPAGEYQRWLGATVVSRKGTILTCAPLSGNNFTGRCFFSQGHVGELELYLPTDESYLDMCGAGFSAALSQEAVRFYVGAPSCQNGAGAIIATTGPDGSEEKLYTDPSYFGYAMAVGNVLDDGTEGLVASVGFDEHSTFSGRVVIIDSVKQDRLVIKRSFTGHQYGEMFGASLLVSDLNGDGKDDIIIGAPHYTVYSNEIHFEIGAVYIYYKSAIEEYHHANREILEGKTSRGRFGYAIASLDADGDGINDLLVGAPYEGSVFVFQGSSNGVRPKHSQQITKEEFKPEFLSFGFSFATNDSSNELAVGAYQSDAVIFIQTRPVIRIAADLNFSPEYLSLESRDCEAEGSFVPCTMMRYCLVYTGKGVEFNTEVKVLIKLDSGESRHRRVLFLQSKRFEKHQLIKLRINEENCFKERIYLKPKSQDKASPIKVELETSLISVEERLGAVLDVYESNGAVSEEILIVNWKTNQTCDKDLQLIVKKNFDTYIQGSKERLVVDVTVRNIGKYDLTSDITVLTPLSMSFITVERNLTNANFFCYPTSFGKSIALRCNISNELKPRTNVQLRAVFKLEPGDSDKVMAFSVAVRGFDAEVLGCVASTSYNETINVKISSSLEVMGWSRPEVLTLNEAMPINFTHFYQVRILGPSDILETKLRISMQRTINEGNLSVKLLAMPEVIEGSAICEEKKHSSSDEIAFNCLTGRLACQTSDRVIVKVLAQLLPNGSLQAKNNFEPICLYSRITANATRLLYAQDPSSISLAMSEFSVEIKGNLLAYTTLKAILKATPMWILLVSTISGLIALTIMTAALNKYRFFGERGAYKLTKDNRIPGKHLLEQITCEEKE